MSYGLPSQWKRGEKEVDTTVPENPIHEKLTRLRETVEELNRGGLWEKILRLNQSVIDQITDLRKDVWKGRIDLWLNPGVLPRELSDVFRQPEMGEVNVHKDPRERKIPHMEELRSHIKQLLGSSSKFPPPNP